MKKKSIWRKREPPYTIGRNINWCGHYEKQYGVSFRNKKYNCYFYEAAITLMSIVSGKDENSNLKTYVHPSVR